MKIAYVTVAFPYGAGEAFFLSETRELIAQGHNLVVVPRSKAGEIVHSADSRVLQATYGEPLFSWKIAHSALLQMLGGPVTCLAAFGVVLRSNGVNTFFKNFVVYPKALWLARLVKQLGVQHIHAQWASSTSSMALMASKVSGVPWSFTAHRGDIAANNMFGFKVRNATFVRFISHSGIRMARPFCKGGFGNKDRLIHMGVDVPREKVQVRATEPTIVCPAFLIPVKGHKYLLQSIALLQKRGVRTTLEVIGDGPLRGELEALASMLHVAGSVKFLGRLPQAALLERYSSSRVTIVVLPSLDLGSNLCEGIPVSLMEAMSFGIPVISTNTGGIPELLGGGAGIIVPPGDPVALANAIESVVLDPGLRAALAERGRERLASEFNTRTTVKSLVECMASVTEPQQKSTLNSRATMTTSL